MWNSDINNHESLSQNLSDKKITSEYNFSFENSLLN